MTRRGFVLPAVLLGLLLAMLGAVVLVGIAAEEVRMARARLLTFAAAAAASRAASLTAERGGLPPVTGPDPSLLLAGTVERITPAWSLAVGVATRSQPATADTAWLVLRELEPGDFTSALHAALTVAGAVHLRETGSIDGTATAATCADGASPANLSGDRAVVASGPVTLSAGASVHGTMDSVSTPLRFPIELRTRDDTAPRDVVVVIANDTVLTEPLTGQVVFALGRIQLGHGAEIHGLLIAAGPLVLEQGALLRGAVFGEQGADVAGAVVYDPCIVATAAAMLAASGPFLPASRRWLPAW